MSSGVVNPSYYADFSGLEALKKSAKADDPQAVRQAARQFESLLTNMMLKAMRETKLGDGLGDSQETQFYQDMFDQQLAVQLSAGKGIGLADMLVQQLTRSGLLKPAPPATGGDGAAPQAPAAVPPSPGPAGNPGTAVPDAERISFINRVTPFAEQAARQLGVSSDALIAQAALETGWGRHLPGSATGGPGFNLFGVKAGSGWAGPSVGAQTVEYHEDAPISLSQPFRSYGSLQQGVDDYVNLLRTSSRYRQALGTGNDVTAFAAGLQRGGYATDPAYVQKLASVAAQVRELRAGATNAPLKLTAGQPTTSGGEPA
jgi:flagellar protein FlgJ